MVCRIDIFFVMKGSVQIQTEKLLSWGLLHILNLRKVNFVCQTCQPAGVASIKSVILVVYKHWPVCKGHITVFVHQLCEVSWQLFALFFLRYHLYFS